MAPGADLEGLAPMLVATANPLFADRTGTAPTEAAVRNAVESIVGGVIRV